MEVGVESAAGHERRREVGRVGEGEGVKLGEWELRAGEG